MIRGDGGKFQSVSISVELKTETMGHYCILNIYTMQPSPIGYT